MPDKKTEGTYSSPAHTPTVIRAHGDVQTRMMVIRVVGGILLLLVVGTFVYPLFKTDTSFKDVWLLTGPIISASIGGLVGYIAGSKNSKSD